MALQLSKEIEAKVKAGEQALKKEAKEEAVMELEKKMHAALVGVGGY